MKLVLKILALPVLFVVKVICILGNLLTNVVSYVIGILLLVIGGSAIYCIVKALFDHSHELTPKEKEIWMLFDRVDVAELLARDAFAKGAYMLGAEDREIMLK